MEACWDDRLEDDAQCSRAQTHCSWSMKDKEAVPIFRAVLNLVRNWDITEEHATVILDLPFR